jgi:hypothetical protein
VLSFAWFADLIGGTPLFAWVTNKPISEGELLIIPTALSFLSYTTFSFLLYRSGRSLLPSLRKVSVTDKKVPKKVLILSLSKIYGKLEIAEAQVKISTRNGDVSMKGVLKNDLDVLSIAETGDNKIIWSGTQLLRALNAHISTVEKIILIGTNETFDKTNLAMVSPEQIKQFLLLYVDSSKCTIDIAYHNPLDPNNVDTSYHQLTKVLNNLQNDSQYKQNDVCIDITGGTAAISAAAALATIHRTSSFQYVSTDGKGTVMRHDLQLTVSPASS